ncbi:MAG: cobaltochelatase subunit CobN [Leptolyngbyaceae cyanobacterium]
MHRLATTPGGWTPDTDGVIFVEQTPAPIIFMTMADTDIQCLARVVNHWSESMPAVRVVNLLQLQQQLAIDTYADAVLSQAQIIILRLLGGRAYWSYGLEVTKAVVEASGTALVVLPGDDRPDPDLMSHSTVPLAVANRLWRYLTEGGVANLRHGLMDVCDRCLRTQFHPPAPQPVPRVGIYPFAQATSRVSTSPSNADIPSIGVLFYRAHYLAGNTAPIDALCQALTDRDLTPVPVYVASLQDPEIQAELLDLLQPQEQAGIHLLLNTTSFAVAKLDTAAPHLDFWRQLNVPVLQVILSGGTQANWQQTPIGLSPRDIAMNVALPEVDGRIITRAVSFKTAAARNERLETNVVTYEPVGDRINFVADLAASWIRLRQTPPARRRIALVLANYPNRDGRLANGVGLDTPQSCIAILRALEAEGYTVPNIPANGDTLMQRLTTAVTNDPESWELRPVWQSLTLKAYSRFFEALPEAVQRGVQQRWGRPDEEFARYETNERRHDDLPIAGELPIAGLPLGNIFVGIQPSRGYDRDPSLNYHAPDLEPTHAYLGFYAWLRNHFQAHAIVHVGKHGNLEWLPGKGIGLSQDCYPEVALGPLPHLYPFIVNDPGEGAQAKRRSQAVIIDHLTPPLTRAGLYGPLQQLEGLVDEYYEAQGLDPTRLPHIRDRILALLEETQVLDELRGLGGEAKVQEVAGVGKQGSGGVGECLLGDSQELSSDRDFADLLPQVDGYLCELKEAQIRDGLHVFGHCPEGQQLRDLLIAIARHPASGRLGLTRAIAADWQLDLDPLVVEMGEPWEWGNREQGTGNREQGTGNREQGIEGVSKSGGVGEWRSGSEVPEAGGDALRGCRTVGDGVAVLEEQAADWVETLITGRSLPDWLTAAKYPQLMRELVWIEQHLLPTLRQTSQEIQALLAGLAGEYVPSGPAGAPTRNRPDVLPTGRNFYAVDIRAIPTESAWDVGRKAAEVLVERYTQEHGEYPQSIGLSMWGTATMRTGGDDLAEAMALLGVRPIWDGPSRRVVDFEILPVAVLGRPRVDVTLRISGFFRDAFPNLIDLFDQAVVAVSQLAESPEGNPLAARVAQETTYWQAQGLETVQAEARSRYRIFGSKPGAYGAGLQGLIEAQNWTDDADLARAYINWSSYAYGRQSQGRSAPEAFQSRLQAMQVVLQNQDNREHDLLDSDDYYQFQGGLTAAVRSVRGESPHTYFGDHAVPENPKVRSLEQEIARVYRSRVINPKWIQGVMRHGYKGAFEMAATVDYLFAYDATTHCVANHMYEGIAQAYLLEETTRQFVQRANPWALRDMSERLLEAHQRRLWTSAAPAMLDALRAIAHAAEADIESHHAPLER